MEAAFQGSFKLRLATFDDMAADTCSFPFEKHPLSLPCASKHVTNKCATQVLKSEAKMFRSPPGGLSQYWS